MKPKLKFLVEFVATAACAGLLPAGLPLVGGVVLLDVIPKAFRNQTRDRYRDPGARGRSLFGRIQFPITPAIPPALGCNQKQKGTVP